ncbi:MAG TPA: UvrD-helicase domain-containing protein [Xanthomonadaceae bacterium]|nr:UvrD-helicase domain-containing protein [Xanthomonadaceae bacterium]
MSAARPVFDALALPLDGLVLVEASAGTGKTHGICSVYLRAVGLEDIDVGSIFVVTFTEAATRELRDRIGKRLRAALRNLDAPPAKSELSALVEAAAAHGISGQVLRRRLRDALVRLDETWVHTIHGLCLRWLTEFAFEGGAGFDELQVDDGFDALRAVLRDLWRERTVAADPVEGRRVQQAFSDIATLLGAVVPLLRVPAERWRGAPGALEQACAHVDALAAEARAVLDSGQLDVLLQCALERGDALNQNSHSEGRLRRLHDELVGAFAEGGTPGGEEDGFAVFSRATLTGAQKKAGFDPHWPPPMPVFDWLEHHGQRWSDALRRYRAALLADIAADAAARLEARAARGVLSYDQVIQRVRAGLQQRDGDWARALRARFRLGIVDEFQDTDGLQYDIFRALLGGEGPPRALVLVGDPKQAIYGFRGGDVHAYRRALDEAGPGRVYTLDVNRRSQAALVKAVNALFEGAEAPFVHDFIPFVPVRPGAQEAAAGDAALTPGLVVWTGEGFTSAPAAELALEQAVCDQIAALLEGPLRTGDGVIAVLTRTNAQARSVCDRLAQLGIESARRDDSSVFHSEAAEEMRRCMHALARPRDRGLARTALASSLFGVSVARLGAGEAQTEDELAALAHAGVVLDTQGPVAALLPLVRAAAARGAGTAGMRRYLADALHLIEWMSAAWPHLTGADALAQRLDEAVARAGMPGAPVPEDEARRPESDRARVQVMTVHRAKGLQFDVVFAPYLCLAKGIAASKLGARIPVVHHDADGTQHLDLGSDLLQEHALAAALDEHSEAIRLAYVALTRAKLRCYTAWFDIDAPGRGAASSPLAWLLHREDGACSDGVVRTGAVRAFGADCIAARLEAWRVAAGGGVLLQPLPHGSPAPVQEPAPPPSSEPLPEFSGSIPHPRRVHSFSALFGADGYRPDADAAWREQPGPEFGGRRLGECAHAALERIAFDAWPQPEQRATLRTTVARFGYPTAVYEWLRERIDVLLRTPLIDDLVLAGTGGADRLVELEFFFPVASTRLDGLGAVLAAHGMAGRIGAEASRQRLHGLMRGFVDLVVRHRGRYYVLDYKTNWLGPEPGDYAPERLATAMREHRYDLQYLIYTVALHRHLRHRLGDGYDARAALGGVAYVFLRGLDAGGRNGLFADRPTPELVEALDRWFGEAGA